MSELTQEDGIRIEQNEATRKKLWITEFERIMFFSNPIRSIKLWEFLNYIPERKDETKLKILAATKDEDNNFWKMADEIENPLNLWIQERNERITEQINQYLENIQQNSTTMSFDEDEMWIIKEALEKTFIIQQEKTEAVIGNIKKQINSFLGK